MLLRAGIVWLGLLGLAVVNGAFRQVVLIPATGVALAHILSTVMLCSVILLLAAMTIRWIGPRDGREAWLAGALWFGLTVAFEFLAGHYLFGTPWDVLLADYDVLQGRVWVLVLLTTTAAPWWALRRTRVRIR
jgi:hypothetical protein